MHSFFVRPALQLDLGAMKSLTPTEPDLRSSAQPLPGFDVIASLLRRNRAIVAVEQSSREVVGFLAGDLVADTVLAVAPEFRRLGVGRALVEHRLATAVEQFDTLLRVRCEPRSSGGFWERMGFTLEEDGGALYAKRALRHVHGLPSRGADATVAVRLFERRPTDHRASSPFVTFSPRARFDDEGFLCFEERAQAFAPASSASSTFVEIEVDGAIVFRGPANGREARVFGLNRQAHGWAMDEILMPEPVA